MVMILQHPMFTSFVYPFLIVFFIVFAVLEKTRLLGEDKKQLNALLSFVIGLVFVSAVYPKMVVENMILFLSVALVIMFVVLMLWGFIFAKEKGFELTSGMKWGLFGVVTVALVIAILWATGVSESSLYNFLFGKPWSEAFWTNLIFIVLIGIALGVIVKGAKSK